VSLLKNEDVKMKFMLVGRDGADAQALDRRMAARQAHIEMCDKMKAQGTLSYAAAILDDSEKMIGSILICDFPTRQDLDNHLKEEPYVKGDVWRDIEIKTIKPGAAFAN